MVALGPMIGERIAHYQILGQLGRGGMGVVYRATDTKLGRNVALKFLPDVLSLTSGALDRFTREARSAAALNHPHICTIYEIGEHEGRPFIAMELLDGGTLADLIGGRPLPIGQSVDIALQVASALDVAHKTGIIHRDIKPANIFVTNSGLSKILDFGLAKHVAATAPAGSPEGATTADEGNLTGVGSTLGTIAYMSPEQARGQDLDGRSDIFSLGLVLYEMVTGRQAFTGETSAVIFDGILNRTPRAPSEANSDVPPELERIIARAIEKDRGKRYQNAADVVADLRHLKRASDAGLSAATSAMPAVSTGAWPSVSPSSGASIAPPAPAPARKRWVPLAAVVAAIAVVGIGLAWWQLRGGSHTLAASDRILIADFGNTTGDAMFDGTLRQALAVKLEESPFLNVVADQRVRETLAYMSRPPDTPVTAGVAREICQRQGIKAVMLGDIATLGASYVVTLTAENCENGDVIAREQVSASSKEQVLAAVGTAAATMRERLGESLASIQRMDKPIGDATTTSLEALKAFSLGDQKRNRGSDQEAIPLLRRAIELDPNFALAHARLGTAYSNIGESKLAIDHRTRAYELRDRVSERERYYITSHYYGGVARDLDKALETYDLWKQTYPNDPIPYINAGLLYSQRGDEERALQGYLKAIELDPMRRFAYGNAISKLIDAGRVVEAKALLAQQVKYLGESDETRLRLYELAGREGDRDAAGKYAAALDKPGPQQPGFLQLRSAELAYYGRLRESQKAATRAVDLLRQQGQAQRANLVVSNQAILAATLEQNAEAKSYADSLKAEPGDPDLLVNLAFVYGVLGETAKARRLYGQVKPGDIPDPAVAQLLSQSFDAMLLLHTGRPAEAYARLESLPDVKQPFLLTCLLTRARAAAASHRWQDAERDYRDVLSRQKGSQFNLAVPISHAGLARALAAQGKSSEARDEFKKFFALWNDADAELPMVASAKAEAAKLGS